MRTISESELGLVVRSQVVKRFHIVQDGSGKYRVNVELNNQEGELTLVTTRKNPREWASLDRLAKHILDKYEPRLIVTLSLQAGDK